MTQLALNFADVPMRLPPLDMPAPIGVRAGRVVGRVWGLDEHREAFRAARASGESVASLARRYGVTPQRIYQVLK